MSRSINYCFNTFWKLVASAQGRDKSSSTKKPAGRDQNIKTIEQLEDFLIDHLKMSKEAKPKLCDPDQILANKMNIKNTINMLNTIMEEQGLPIAPTTLSDKRKSEMLSFVPQLVKFEEKLEEALKTK